MFIVRELFGGAITAQTVPDLVDVSYATLILMRFSINILTLVTYAKYQTTKRCSRTQIQVSA